MGWGPEERGAEDEFRWQQAGGREERRRKQRAAGSLPRRQCRLCLRPP
ncbi:hypothetical protein TIFTF001_010776 [Ficus carica]|uniref:Uncharacterized protein n=1 Tax=Ficus carica TaxID=3494 RepID=A0AA88A966_FICCA|nr:hypothetical protein TIFTF001_010776 [Ficus carica]